MSCCAAGTNVCLNLRCRAFPPGGQVCTEWRADVQASMAQHARDSATPCHKAQQVGCLQG